MLVKKYLGKKFVKEEEKLGIKTILVRKKEKIGPWVCLRKIPQGASLPPPIFHRLCHCSSS